MLLRDYREKALDTFLDFLWQSWNALGVPGHVSFNGRLAIDPEALLAFTCSMARYDPRLFDEVIAWLSLNGKFLNVQRIKTIMRSESFAGAATLAAVAGWLSHQESAAKWERLAEKNGGRDDPVPLFYLPDGRPLPVSPPYDAHFLAYGLMRNPVRLRGHACLFNASAHAALFLKMRALFGVNSRCDVLVYLLLNDCGHPRAIARELYYSQKAIHDVLSDLACSGSIYSTRNTRERIFRISAEGRKFLLNGAPPLAWINWPVLLAAAESVWRLLDEQSAPAEETDAHTSEICLRMKPILERLYAAPWMPSPESCAPGDGAGLLEAFLKAFKTIAFLP